MDKCARLLVIMVVFNMACGGRNRESQTKCRATPACASGVCSSDGHCEPPSCRDQVRNGTETGVDCGGGGDCGRCGVGQECRSNSDCEAGNCQQHYRAVSERGVCLLPGRYSHYDGVGHLFVNDTPQFTYTSETALAACREYVDATASERPGGLRRVCAYYSVSCPEGLYLEDGKHTYCWQTGAGVRGHVLRDSEYIGAWY